MYAQDSWPQMLACAKAGGAAGSHGDVELDADMMGMRQKTAAIIRLLKGNDGWVDIEEKR
ncbi:MAG: hypothetical protein ABL983_15280 [Nitrospira sp.]